ncbi:hypothetical protein JTE90_029463 [Oedothorax gibbosus]|uniref:Uncharacterized protein n=1 Tax=Oedothorax gibbosus TaxID=931172 RepID=A0AAV6V2V9_9ARAC|nr:hypothetical protein JTE90_029463 [Oedothorax gibbosus]
MPSPLLYPGTRQKVHLCDVLRNLRHSKPKKRIDLTDPNNLRQVTYVRNKVRSTSRWHCWWCVPLPYQQPKFLASLRALPV